MVRLSGQPRLIADVVEDLAGRAGSLQQLGIGRRDDHADMGMAVLAEPLDERAGQSFELFSLGSVDKGLVNGLDLGRRGTGLRPTGKDGAFAGLMAIPAGPLLVAPLKAWRHSPKNLARM